MEIANTMEVLLLKFRKKTPKPNIFTSCWRTISGIIISCLIVNLVVCILSSRESILFVSWAGAKWKQTWSLAKKPKQTNKQKKPLKNLASIKNVFQTVS